MPRVVGYASDNGGVAYYRICSPLHEMERQGLIELRSTNKKMMPFPFIRDEEDEAAKARKMYHEDGQWAQLLHTGRYQDFETKAIFWGMSVSNGLPWILDLDDNVLAIEEENPAHEFFRKRTPEEMYDTRVIASPDEAKEGELVFKKEDTGELQAVRMKEVNRHAMTRDQIMEADALTVSTKDLAHLYGNMRRHRHKRDHIYVLPNSIDPKVWDAVPPPPDHSPEVWIGWAGSSSHFTDTNMLVGVAEYVLGKYPNVRFFWTRLPTPGLVELGRKYGQRCLLVEAWAAIEDWPDLYKSMNLDIALIPLGESPFARARSNLKWLEAGINKQAAVCSRVQSYDCVRNRKDGFLAARPKDWLKAITSLVESSALRENVGGAAYEKVMKDYNLEKNVALWREAYNDVLADLGDMAAERTKNMTKEVA